MCKFLVIVILIFNFIQFKTTSYGMNSDKRWDIISYKMDMHLENKKVAVHLILTFKNLLAQNKKLNFFLNSSIMPEVKLNNKKLQLESGSYSLSPFMIIPQYSLIFDQSLEEGEIYDLEINYELTYSKEKLYTGMISKDYIELSIENMWYPSELSEEIFNWEMKINVPFNFEILTEGNLDKIEEYSDRKIYYFSSNHCAGIRLTGGVYKKLNKKVKNTQIYFLYRSDVDELFPLITKLLPTILDFYKEKFFLNINEISVVERIDHGFQRGNRGGVGYISFSNNYLDMIKKLNEKGREYRFFSGLSHELAHAIFGDTIHADVLQPGGVWLNEGFAVYLSLLAYEKKYGKGIYKKYFLGGMGFHGLYNLLEKTPTVSLNEITLINFMKYGIAYGKGCWILHTLRYICGDEIFFKILQEYIRRYEYKFVTIEDFKNIVREFYPFDIDWFFEDWIYGIKEVDYKISRIIENKIYIEREGEARINNDIEIEVETDKKKKVLKFNFLPDKKETSVKVDGKIKRIIIDPNFWIVDKNRWNNYFPKMGYIGIEYKMSEEDGIHIIKIYKDSVAEKINLKEGDRIIYFNNKKIEDNRQLEELLFDTKEGEEVEIEILKEGKIKIIKFKLDGRTDDHGI